MKLRSTTASQSKGNQDDCSQPASDSEYNNLQENIETSGKTNKNKRKTRQTEILRATKSHKTDSPKKRISENSYELPGEVLPKYTAPPNKSMDVKPLRMKSLIVELIKKAIATWPTIPEEHHHAEDKTFICHVFYCMQGGFLARFSTFLNDDLNRYTNANEQEKKEKLESLQRDIHDTEMGVLAQVLHLFQDMGSKSGNETLQACIKMGNEFQKHIKSAKKAGKTCLSRATWIGFEENPIHNHSHMVETDAQTTQLSTAVNVGNYCDRICAPSDDKLWPLIFWTKDDCDDQSPSPDKIFGAVVYHPEKLTHNLGENAFNIGAAELERLYIHYKGKVKRSRLESTGEMVKGSGMHAVNHILYKAEVKQSQKPELEFIMPVYEAIHHEFYKAFLPHWAAEHENVAKQNPKLMNALGYPSASTFATYGYSAGLHLDNDSTPTRGWVMQRPDDLSRETSNFVWGSHRLILEMQQNLFWYWDARKHYHGTTLSDNAIKELSGQKKENKNDKERSGQWTQAAVFPVAVVNAR